MVCSLRGAEGFEGCFAFAMGYKGNMSDHIYKKVELVGSSKESLEGAISNAVERASQSLHNLRWFEVKELRGHIVEGKVDHWQVGVKIGFTLDGEDDDT